MKLTAIVTCHTEGHLAWRSLRSALAALRHVPESELLIVLDAPDDVTREVAHRFVDEHAAQHRVSAVELDARDLGTARNAAVTVAKGKYVAFLDADDIWGERWLQRAVAQAEADDEEQHIYHSQLVVNFGTDTMWWQHTDSRDAAFDPSVFFLTNHWTALCLARRSLLLSEPYAPVGHGFGFEDWEWNTRTLARGCVHVVVPETVHFIRKRSSSMSQAHAAQARTTRPNDFFETRAAAQTQDVAKLELGEWLLDEWRLAHQVEPMLYPRPRELASRPQYTPPNAPAVYNVYHRIKSALPKDATHLILCAGLGGGADLRARKYASAADAAGGKAVVLVTDAKSRGLGDCLEAHGALSVLDETERARVVQRLMLQALHAGVTVHIVNSRVAWMAAAQNPDALAALGVVFASLYAFEAQPQGTIGGYAANGAFSSAAPALCAVLTDNHAFKRELADKYGWTKTVVAPTPILVGDQPAKTRQPAHAIRVLWASRVDWNKRAELVADIAAEALRRQGSPILFDVAGDSRDYASFAALSRLRALPNVKLRPEYRAFEQLAPQSYDVFLFTSRKEGMPNVVLEALASGLPVVASPAGELGALSEADFPGRIVGSDDPAKWVDAILETAAAHHNPTKWVRDRHSPDKFLGALRKAGYFPEPKAT
jgi:hypothetical protein